MVLFCSDATKWEAVLPKEKLSMMDEWPGALLSVNGLIFTFNGDTTFMIHGDLTYVLSRLDLQLDPNGLAFIYSLEDGHCETFEE